MNDNIGKLIAWFCDLFRPRWDDGLSNLMRRELPRSYNEFMLPFSNQETAGNIAARTWKYFAQTYSIPGCEFRPHLSDKIECDYGIVGSDLDTLLFEVLREYKLPQKDIKGPDIPPVIVTVFDLILFATAVADRYSTSKISSTSPPQ